MKKPSESKNVFDLIYSPRINSYVFFLVKPVPCIKASTEPLDVFSQRKKRIAFSAARSFNLFSADITGCNQSLESNENLLSIKTMKKMSHPCPAGWKYMIRRLYMKSNKVLQNSAVCAMKDVNLTESKSHDPDHLFIFLNYFFFFPFLSFCYLQVWWRKTGEPKMSSTSFPVPGLTRR